MSIINIPLDKNFKGRAICTREELQELIKKIFQDHVERMDRHEPVLQFIDVFTATELGGGKLDVVREHKVVTKELKCFYGCPFTITYRHCYIS